MKVRTQNILAALLIVLMIALVGCSSPTQGDNSKDAPKTLPPLKVASTPTGPPFTFLNSQNNKMEGIMVDIITSLAQKMGRTVEIEPIAFSSLIPSLQGQKVDLISAGMYITDERKQVIDFTDPIFSFGEGLVVRKDDTSIQGLSDLAGKTLGVQTGTVYGEKLGKLVAFKEIKSYKAVGDMITELANKRIDGFVADAPIAAYLIQKDPSFQVRLVDTYKASVTGDVGIGVSKDNTQLKDDLNKAIKTLKDSGELKTILEKWGVKG